jgi:hypothetical protein
MRAVVRAVRRQHVPRAVRSMSTGARLVVVVALGLSTTLPACRRTAAQRTNDAPDAVATSPSFYKQFTSAIPRESGLRRAEGGPSNPGPFVFAIRFVGSEGPQAWEVAIDESRFVWGSLLSRGPSGAPSGAPTRWTLLGSIDDRVFQRMEGLRRPAADTVPRTVTHDCSDCGQPEAFVYRRAGDEASRVVIASGGGGSKAPGSKQADEVTGWLFAVQRDVPKFDALFRHLQQ